MKYHQKRNKHKIPRKIRITIIGLSVVVIVALSVGAFLLYIDIKRIDYNPDDQTTTPVATKTIVSKDQTFQSPYFQFVAGKHWQEETKDRKEGVYIYRSTHGGLLEQQLSIYVNGTPPDVQVTHVLPVTVSESGIAIGPVSDHCGKGAGYREVLHDIVIDGVTVNCFGDATRYTVLAGLVGGDSRMKLQRPDGSSAQYVVYYSNVTARPSPTELQDIMNTFQIR